MPAPQSISAFPFSPLALLFLQEKRQMEINHFILVLISLSLSCLFSFSASTRAPSPAPSSSFVGHQSSSFEAEGEGENTDQSFTIFPGSIDPGLERICGETDYPIECLTTTVPFLGESVAIEPVSILKVGIQAMNNMTNEALAKATMLVMDPSTPDPVASCLETCIDSYDAILESNQKVLDAISIRDLYQLSLELSSNVENVHTCEDAFDEVDLDSPIREMDLLLGKMISNNLAIGVDMVRF